MGEVSNIFLAEFHNLSGDTIKEKQRSLFDLFRRHLAYLKENPTELDEIASNLRPNGHLETIFRIDFLIYFRRTNELYEELRNGDEITLSKLAKQEWFFREAFKDFGAEKFVNDVLPTMPYVAKLKILRKLALDEKENDDVFEALYKRYGLDLALVFLPKCSVDKIEQILKNHLIKLTPAQLKIIYKKEPRLIEIYLEERAKHEGNYSFMDNNPIFVDIAQNNPELFANLFNKYKFKTKLGQRTTKKFVDLQKSDVEAKLEDYVNVLKQNSLVRKLGPELTKLFFKKESETENFFWNSFIKYYPKKNQFDLFKTAYNDYYYCNFGDDLDDVTEDVLKIIPDLTERECLAKAKLKKEENDDYFKYVDPNYCLEEFTQRLSNTNSAERSKFVDILTGCCVLNENLDVFLKVAELVAVRFKNDGRNVRYQFFNVLMTSKKSFLEKLEEEHWKFVIDIIMVIKVKNEFCYGEFQIRLQYIKFLIKNDKPIREVLLKFDDWLDYLRYRQDEYDSEIVKPILLELIDLGYPKPNAEDNEKAYYDCCLVKACQTYNKKNPKNTIDVFSYPRLLESMKSVLETDDDYIDCDKVDAVVYCICQKNPSENIQDIIKLYFKKFKLTGRLETCMWFLKHDSKTLADNFNEILSNFIEIYNFNQKKLWRIVKKYSHLNLDKRTVEFCRTKLTEEGFAWKKDVVKPLSILSTIDAHLEFMNNYIPKEAKADLNDDAVKELYEIQCELVKKLHYINSPLKVLKMALNFCKGDYLSSALAPIYSSFCRLPENETKSFILEIEANQALSVKKHAITLSCLIYDNETVINNLKQATVPVLMPAFKYFTKHPDEQLWKIVETSLLKIEKQDVQSLKNLLTITIPIDYKSRLIEILWKIFDKYETNKLKQLLVSNINNNVITKLDPKFSFEIIEGNLFKIEESNDFVSNLLIHLDDNDKFDVIGRILTEFKENSWNSNKRQPRRELFNFISSLYATYMKLKESNSEFVMNFSTKFSEIFSVVEAFRENILLQFMKQKNENVEEIAKFLVGFNNDLINKYNKYILESFVNAVNNFLLPQLVKSDLHKFRLCQFLLQNKQSDADYLLILKILPTNEPKDVENVKLYEDILSHLFEVDDEVIQIELNEYLSN